MAWWEVALVAVPGGVVVLLVNHLTERARCVMLVDGVVYAARVPCGKTVEATAATFATRVRREREAAPSMRVARVAGVPRLSAGKAQER